MHNNLLTQLIITYNIFIFYIQYQKIDISLIYEDHMFNILKKRGAFSRYIKISIASHVAIKYKGDTPIKYYGDV